MTANCEGASSDSCWEFYGKIPAPPPPPPPTSAPAATYYLEAKGTAVCTAPGKPVSKADCEAAVASVLEGMGKTPGGPMVVGTGEYTCKNAWGQTLLGCSLQDDDDTAHYRENGVAQTGCESSGYQLVCQKG